MLEILNTLTSYAVVFVCITNALGLTFTKSKLYHLDTLNSKWDRIFTVVTYLLLATTLTAEILS